VEYGEGNGMTTIRRTYSDKLREGAWVKLAQGYVALVMGLFSGM